MELVRTDPAQFRRIQCAGHASPFPANIKQQQQLAPLLPGRGAEAGRGEAGGLGFDAKLFGEFAYQRCFRRFVLFDLPAGELPKPRHRPAGGALLNEHPAIGIHKRRRDDHQQIGHVTPPERQILLTPHVYSSTGAFHDRAHNMLKWVRKLKGDQDGATAVEYGLILALVVLAAMGAIVGLAGTTIEMWNSVANNVSRA